MANLETLCMSAVEVGQKAAKLIKERFNDVHKIKFKGTVDLVTEVDIASEKLIRKLMHEKYPKIRFHGEEEGGENWQNGEIWLVDPIDGTTNFANKLPHFCVSIALCHDGQPVVACIIQPITGDIYYSWKNGGAWLNGKLMRVSSVINTDQALAVTGFPYNRRENIDETMKYLKAMLMRTQCVRRLGSAALDLCYVARGIYSIYWEANLKPWDIAAGKLLVKEAGGKVSKYDGSKMELDSYELLATNSILHDEAIKILAEA